MCWRVSGRRAYGPEHLLAAEATLTGRWAIFADMAVRMVCGPDVPCSRSPTRCKGTGRGRCRAESRRRGRETLNVGDALGSVVDAELVAILVAGPGGGGAAHGVVVLHRRGVGFVDDGDGFGE